MINSKKLQEFPINDVKEAFKLLLHGSAGTGKTTLVLQFVEAGYNVRVICLDPNSRSGLLSSYNTLYGKRQLKGTLHVKSVNDNFSRAPGQIKKRLEMIKSMNYSDYLKKGDTVKSSKQMLDILESLEVFVSDSGTDLGKVCDWKPTDILVIDGLTALIESIKNIMVGRGALSLPTIGGIQGMLMDIFNQILIPGPFSLIILAHSERSTDPLTGRTYVFPAVIGQALAAKFPSVFTDVIYTYTDGDKFLWSNSSTGVNTRHQFLPRTAEAPQDILPLIKSTLVSLETDGLFL